MADEFGVHGVDVLWSLALRLRVSDWADGLAALPGQAKPIT